MELPERINRLDDLASNLWWSWHPEARNLFKALDYTSWRTGFYNPVKQLCEIIPDKLRIAAGDSDFLALYDSVISAFDSDLSLRNTWFSTAYPGLISGPVAYFSMEFAFHDSLPIYAGGLGILAGDTCKEASDLGIPLIGIGFMYPQGYFHQHITADGWQEEIYEQLDFSQAPIKPVLSPEGSRTLAQVEIDSRLVSIGAWRVDVGHNSICLLDTGIQGNHPQDKQLSSRLYIADQEMRLQQEMVLGIGGVRVLRALGIKPALWHANEGHAAFMMLERLRHVLEKGMPLKEALREIPVTTVFTTHTPVPAGHDTFSVQLMEKYFHNYWDTYDIDRKAFLKLGQMDSTSDQDFNMTVLAMKMAAHRNAVSQLHGEVSRKMWRNLWPVVKEDGIPITSVTNGIHVPTWVAAKMDRLFCKYLGEEWLEKQDDVRLFQKIVDIPEEEIWNVRQHLKRKLLGAMRERSQKRWTENGVPARQVLAMGSLLDHDAITIGFVRRFTEYKRPALIFRDIERLKRIIRHRWQPVQIVFAGKSHPADMASKDLLRKVYSLALDRDFRGRIAFVEDYDIRMARYLVQGVDVWLNTPRRLREASGTSGMKAALNGVLHLSVPDGWWHEGYNGSNGWVIGNENVFPGPEEEDEADSEALYQLLEEQVVPLYYLRDRFGVPRNWVGMIKESIRSIVPVFCARRMLKEYTERIYTPAIKSAGIEEIL